MTEGPGVLGDLNRIRLAYPKPQPQLGFATVRVDVGRLEKDHGEMGSIDAGGGLIMSLSVRSPDGTYRVENLGTAAMVAPGVALAAAHCVDDVSKGEQIYCIGHSMGKAFAWRVDEVQLVSATDLAILSMTLASEPPHGHRFAGFAMTTRTLRKGEIVRMLGYSELVHEGRDPQIAHKGGLWSSTGVVMGVFEDGGSSSGRLKDAPCALVDWGHRGGMSGGPVFDSDGFLIALFSTGYKGYEEVEPCGYVSFLWPALAVPIVGGWPVPLAPAKPLIELEIVCEIEGRDRVGHGQPDAVTGISKVVCDFWYERMAPAIDNDPRHYVNGTGEVIEPAVDVVLKNCMYCGSDDMSGEHIHAAWMKPYLAETASTNHYLANERLIGDLEDPPEVVQLGFHHRTGDHRGRKIRCVCQRCNNGWMNEIQTRARPGLEPVLAEGHSAQLPSGGLAHEAACWAVMYSMTFEIADRIRTTTEEQRRIFFESKGRTVPPGWHVWFGACDDARAPKHIATLRRTSGPAYMAKDVQTTTAVMGKLVMVACHLLNPSTSVVQIAAMEQCLRGFGFARMHPPVKPTPDWLSLMSPEKPPEEMKRFTMDHHRRLTAALARAIGEPGDLLT